MRRWLTALLYRLTGSKVYYLQPGDTLVMVVDPDRITRVSSLITFGDLLRDKYGVKGHVLLGQVDAICVLGIFKPGERLPR